MDSQIRQIQDALDTLLRIQQRSADSALYNKANELQEDISMKRFDLRVAQMHLSAINAQVRNYNAPTVVSNELLRFRTIITVWNYKLQN